MSVVEPGLSGADDPTVRRAAIDSGRVLVTLDADFANVLRYPPSETPGVIRLRLHPPTDKAIARTLLSLTARLTNTDLKGKLVVVDERKIRIRGS